MQAVEFETTIEDGIIRIPKNIDRLHQIKKAKFIMIYDDTFNKINFNREESHRMDSVDMIFDEYSFDMSKFKFDRDEANER